MSLQQTIRECLPEKKEIPSNVDDDSIYPVWVNGYNNALIDIEAKLPEIEKKLLEKIGENIGYGNMGFSRTEKGKEGIIAIELDDIINLLTKE